MSDEVQNICNGSIYSQQPAQEETSPSVFAQWKTLSVECHATNKVTIELQEGHWYVLENYFLLVFDFPSFPHLMMWDFRSSQHMEMWHLHLGQTLPSL